MTSFEAGSLAGLRVILTILIAELRKTPDGKQAVDEIERVVRQVEEAVSAVGSSDTDYAKGMRQAFNQILYNVHESTNE